MTSECIVNIGRNNRQPVLILVGPALLTLLCGTLPLAANNVDAEASNKPTLQPRVEVNTSLGRFVVELDAQRAPGTVLNFVHYVEDKFYDGTVFHRVISQFVIQGGEFTPDLQRKTTGIRDPIKNEWRNGLKNTRGTVAMARLGNQPDSARAGFFVNVTDNDYLDKPRDGAGYCVFGRVLEGMEVADGIRDVPVTSDARFDGGRNVIPVTPVIIQSIRMQTPLDTVQAQTLAASFEEVVARIRRQEEREREHEVEARLADFEKKYEKKMTRTQSGLCYLDVRVGSGLQPKFKDGVSIHYRGFLPDGSEFDNSWKNPELGGQPWRTSVYRLIDGWAEGLQTMQEGGKRILVIPPKLSFGKRGRKNVPSNTTVFYEIELLQVTPGPDTAPSDAPAYSD